ncbi:hypothetical protein L7F22_056590 [Adiantum nelumboides]|nr:hypothetical protein [Adiantum nelumboides]
MSATIFGPESRTRLIVRSAERYVEISSKEIAENFQISSPFSLFPATLGAENLKLECLQLSTGCPGFILDTHVHLFYKVQIETIVQPCEMHLVVSSDEEVPDGKKYVQSVLDLIRHEQPKGSSLHVALHSAVKNLSVDELPTQYDGYVAFELPPSDGSSTMFGMEHRFDGHVWADYVTCNSDCFPEYKGVGGSFGDSDLNELLSTVTPLNDRRRIQRSVQEVKRSKGYGSFGLEDADPPKDAWENLIAINTTNTRARKIQLKNELNKIKKGDLSVNDYTLKIKALCESLSSIGVTMDDDDKVEACLRGLGNAYKQFKTSICTQENIPHFLELSSLLVVEKKSFIDDGVIQTGRNSSKQEEVEDVMHKGRGRGCYASSRRGRGCNAQRGGRGK